MQSAAKHLAWRSNFLRLQASVREMLRCALHDLILPSDSYLMYVYMLTNNIRTVLYTGVTNDLTRRLAEHNDTLGQHNKFTDRYQANLLVYFDVCADPMQAIAREKEIKGWSRAKKEALIANFNPTWAAIDLETWTGAPDLH
jgi:putative endonuclease